MTQTVRHIGCDVSLLKREIFKDVSGYMPVGRHYGFIYNEFNNSRTIVHELGHGTNTLHHTFSDDSESFHTAAKTDNLMDYNGGTALNHRQWQWSHEKHRNVLGFLDGEEESEASIMLKEYELRKSFVIINRTDTVYNTDTKYYLNTTKELSISHQLNSEDLQIKILNSGKLTDFQTGISEYNLKIDTSKIVLYVYKSEDKINVQDSIFGSGKTYKVEKNNIVFVADYSKAIFIKYNDLDEKWHELSFTKEDYENFGFILKFNIQIVETPVARFYPKDVETYYMKYGFDDAELIENQQSGYYDKVKIAGSDYFIPVMYIYNGEDNEVSMKVSSSNNNSSAYYKIRGTKPGTKINGQSEFTISDLKNNECSFRISSEVMGVDTLTVYYCIDNMEVVSGKLIVYYRDELEIESPLRFVVTKTPLDSEYPSFDAQKIFNEINEYYAQAGVKFLDFVTDSIIMQECSSDMNVMISKLKGKNYKLESGTCYIFIHNKHEHDDGNKRHPNGESFYPNSSYVFSIARIFEIRPTTISHELGHILGLPHVFEIGNIKGHSLCFDNSNDVYTKKYSTRNLLDYVKNDDGSDLRKYFNKKQIDHIYENINKIIYKTDE